VIAIGLLVLVAGGVVITVGLLVLFAGERLLDRCLDIGRLGRVARRHDPEDLLVDCGHLGRLALGGCAGPSLTARPGHPARPAVSLLGDNAGASPVQLFPAIRETITVT